NTLCCCVYWTHRRSVHGDELLPDCTINALLVWHFGSDICHVKPSTRACSSLLPSSHLRLLPAAPKSSPSTSARSHKGRNTTLAATSLYVADTSAESPRTSVAPSTLLHTPSAIGVLLHLPVFYFADVLCYLYSVGNLELSDAALELPVFVPLSKCAGLVHCVEP
ncbi:hypothetical protein GW17_00054062, partial [Ensete ventricosum]